MSAQLECGPCASLHCIEWTPQSRGVGTLSRPSSHWAGEGAGQREFFLEVNTADATRKSKATQWRGRGRKRCGLSVGQPPGASTMGNLNIHGGVCGLFCFLCHWAGERCGGN